MFVTYEDRAGGELRAPRSPPMNFVYQVHYDLIGGGAGLAIPHTLVLY